MSIYRTLVLSSVARSNHHRIAILALDRMRNLDAGLWRDAFLKHHKPYFEGAKAPDDRFKDFKNHVLHVQDGFWGGAPEAAQEWYVRTVRALKAGKFADAIYNAGVLSHYVVDPVQPFHTGQTEEEGVIHRAVEWSFSKAFKEMHLILEQDLGYPTLEAPTGPNWLSDMICAAATHSNRHYETLIEHYNFALGVKKPVEGLDQELKDVTAGLIGYAAELLGRVLDRAIEESGAEPPDVNLVLDTLFAGMTMPIRAMLAAIEDAGERKLVQAQWEEFQKTGKVRATLSEDDKTVRALHAAEVLNTPLSSLDCKWPRETGLAHGSGAPARKTRKLKRPAWPKPAPVAQPAAAAEAPVILASPAPEPVAQAAVEPPQAPIPARPAEKAARGPRLSPADPVVDAPSIGPKGAERLAAAGVATVADLLHAAPERLAEALGQRHISAATVAEWQDQALLCCTVPDLTGTAAQILVACGVRDAAALGAADDHQLARAVQAFCDSAEGRRLLRDGPAPGRDAVARWIASARGLAMQAA